MSFVVVPSFDVAPENLAAFLEAARADAVASVRDEPGCEQFDIVLNAEDSPRRVMFYEVYASRDAFEAHLETPHLKAFREALSLCNEGPVQMFERIEP